MTAHLRLLKPRHDSCPIWASGERNRFYRAECALCLKHETRRGPGGRPFLRGSRIAFAAWKRENNRANIEPRTKSAFL
jgi:hypothetical protein